MTDCKTHYITKVVNEMKLHQTKLINDYLDNGVFSEENYEFFDTEYL